MTSDQTEVAAFALVASEDEGYFDFVLSELRLDFGKVPSQFLNYSALEAGVEKYFRACKRTIMQLRLPEAKYI